MAGDLESFALAIKPCDFVKCLILFLFASRLTPHRVSDIDCARVLAEFNCGTNTLSRNGVNHSINRHMTEISSQPDESSKNSPISVIFNVCDNDEPVCCDVESFMTSLAQDLKAEESDFVQSTDDERTIGANGNSVTDNSSEVCDSENSEGGHIQEESEGERCAGETCLRAEGCLNNSNSGTEEQNKNVQQSQQDESIGVQQVYTSETESHIHIESSTSFSAETFNTFQYWRIPVPELQLDISLAETGRPTAVLADKTTQQTSASELNVDMDIDVSSLQGLP
jgi:hypothetical protein